jgi:hypothetical protein
MPATLGSKRDQPVTKEVRPNQGSGAGARRDRISGPTQKVNLTFAVTLLDRIDEHAERIGVSRSAFLSLAATLFMDNLLERRRE